MAKTTHARTVMTKEINAVPAMTFANGLPFSIPSADAAPVITNITTVHRDIANTVLLDNLIIVDVQDAKVGLTIPISNEKYQLNRMFWCVREISQNDTKRKFCSLDKAAISSDYFRPKKLAALR